jgi:hypothetical protein
MSLQAAIDAVRDESVERGTAELMTRRRVLASIERSPSRRVHALVAAVIATMFGASAFAWYARAPERATPVVVQEMTSDVATAEPIASPERVAVRVEPTADVEPAAAVEPAARVEAAVVTPVETEPPPRPEPRLAVEPHPEPRLAVEPQPSPQPDAELALYGTAHRLHFQQHDLVAAVDAWDRYLAAAPAGKLAPEARFNRLVALVRLQRWDDAAHALDAFDDPSFRPADLAKLRKLISSRRLR